eukprot:1139019-Pelagomonas_calceolata.AAC.11
MAGTEGGKIFRCFFDMNDLQAGIRGSCAFPYFLALFTLTSFSPSTAAKEFQRALAGGEMKEKQDLRCPIKEASYVPHAGSVYSMDCSPYQVLEAGLQHGNMSYYACLKSLNATSRFPNSKWLDSRAHTSLFAGDGRVYLYDLLQTTDVIRPALVLDAGNLINSPTYALAFNSKKSDLLATGDAAGIKVITM